MLSLGYLSCQCLGLREKFQAIFITDYCCGKNPLNWGGGVDSAQSGRMAVISYFRYNILLVITCYIHLHSLGGVPVVGLDGSMRSIAECLLLRCGNIGVFWMVKGRAQVYISYGAVVGIKRHYQNVRLSWRCTMSWYCSDSIKSFVVAVDIIISRLTGTSTTRTAPDELHIHLCSPFLLDNQQE